MNKLYFSIITLCVFCSNILQAKALATDPQDEITFVGPSRVIGVGTACIDVCISVEDDFLSKYVPGQKGGCYPLDQDTLLQIKQMNSSPPKFVPGGCSANTIRALAKLGERCALLSHVGNDEFGKRISEGLYELGIGNYISTLSHYMTDWALCMITPDGERTIRFLHQEPSYLEVSGDVFKGAELVYIEAYRLQFGDMVERTMELAQSSLCKIAINLGSKEVVSRHKKRLLDLLSKYVDVVFANEDEICALTGLPPLEGCIKLQEVCPIVVVTQGPKECLIAHKDAILSVPAFSAHVVDTTGAGDFFASGFLYGYLRGYPLSTCARIGHCLGSAITEVIGAELSEEKWQEMYSFIQSEPK